MQLSSHKKKVKKKLRRYWYKYVFRWVKAKVNCLYFYTCLRHFTIQTMNIYLYKIQHEAKEFHFDCIHVCVYMHIYRQSFYDFSFYLYLFYFIFFFYILFSIYIYKETKVPYVLLYCTVGWYENQFPRRPTCEIAYVNDRNIILEFITKMNKKK